MPFIVPTGGTPFDINLLYTGGSTFAVTYDQNVTTHVTTSDSFTIGLMEWTWEAPETLNQVWIQAQDLNTETCYISSIRGLNYDGTTVVLWTGVWKPTNGSYVAKIVTTMENCYGYRIYFTKATGDQFTIFDTKGYGSAIEHTLTLNVVDSGGSDGSVWVLGGGYNTTCSVSQCIYPDIASASSITLTAEAPAGTIFTGWSGGPCSGTNSVCTFNMDSDYTITANFTAVTTQRMLTVYVQEPFGTNCWVTTNYTETCGGVSHPNQDTCYFYYNDGTNVVLTAHALSPYQFDGWEGAGCSGTGTCSIIMTSDKIVTANFSLFGQQSNLVVNLNPVAGGYVTIYDQTTSTNIGTCTEATCSYLVPTGHNIQVTHYENTGYNWINWSGGTCSGSSTSCLFTINADTIVTANWGGQCSVNLGYSGQGDVTITPMDCLWPTTCDCGTYITLTATPDTGWHFVQWNGTGAGSYSGTESNVTLQIEGNISEIAVFEIGSGTQGACCYLGNCTTVYNSECLPPSVWKGGSCTPNPCLSTGACCIDGLCSLKTYEDCTANNGIWKGTAVSCTPNPCDSIIPDELMQYLPYILIGVGALILITALGD